VELKSTPNITVIAAYPNMCLWIKKKEKYKKQANTTTITISRVTSEFVWKIGVFKTWKKRFKDYIKKINDT
jgi:hypothetical protein